MGHDRTTCLNHGAPWCAPLEAAIALSPAREPLDVLLPEDAGAYNSWLQRSRLGANDFAISRIHSRKRSTTGLSVRFFNVTSATGHGRAGNSTGSTTSENLSAKRHMDELGNVAI